MRGRSANADGGSPPRDWRDWRAVIADDLAAMCEGEPVGRGQMAMRLVVHPRWRAVVRWRLASACMQRKVTKAVGLWLTGRTLAICGAELQPLANVAPGLVLKHTTGLVVGGEVVAGPGLVLHQNVTLGDRRPGAGQPRLGANVVVGAGACVLGPICVGDDVIIAANSVVLEDVPSFSTVAGAPAKIVRSAGHLEENQHEH